MKKLRMSFKKMNKTVSIFTSRYLQENIWNTVL